MSAIANPAPRCAADVCEAIEYTCGKVGLFNLLEAASYTYVAHHMQTHGRTELSEGVHAGWPNTVMFLCAEPSLAPLQGEQASQGQAPHGHGNIEIPVKQGFVVQNPDGSVPAPCLALYNSMLLTCIMSQLSIPLSNASCCQDHAELAHSASSSPKTITQLSDALLHMLS